MKRPFAPEFGEQQTKTMEMAAYMALLITVLVNPFALGTPPVFLVWCAVYLFLVYDSGRVFRKYDRMLDVRKYDLIKQGLPGCDLRPIYNSQELLGEIRARVGKIALFGIVMMAVLAFALVARGLVQAGN